MTMISLRTVSVAVALSLTAGAASAADLARAPAPVAPAAPYPETIVAYGFNWTGAYVGAHAGNRWVSGGRGLDSSAIAGGLQAGYLVQSGAFVYGLEADVTYGSNEKSRSVAGGRVGSSIDWQGSGRARLGYAFDRVLVYGTGGITAADFEAFGRGPTGNSRKSDTLIGWTAGGGLEYALTKNVSVRGEYLYSDFGSQTVRYPGTGLASSKQDVNSHLARIGVNFKF